MCSPHACVTVALPSAFYFLGVLACQAEWVVLQCISCAASHMLDWPLRRAAFLNLVGSWFPGRAVPSSGLVSFAAACSCAVVGLAFTVRRGAVRVALTRRAVIAVCPWLCTCLCRPSIKVRTACLRRARAQRAERCSSLFCFLSVSVCSTLLLYVPLTNALARGRVCFRRGMLSAPVTTPRHLACVASRSTRVPQQVRHPSRDVAQEISPPSLYMGSDYGTEAPRIFLQLPRRCSPPAQSRRRCRSVCSLSGS